MAQKLLLLLCFYFLWLAANPAFCQQTIDFLTALELARKNNPDWRAAEQEVEMVRGKVTTARLINPFNPVLEGRGGPRSIPGERNHTDYGVGLSMELEVVGQRGLRITEAERSLQRAESTYKDFSRSFTAKLARAFFQALFARERLALLRRVEDLNRRLLDVTQIKFQAGDVSGLETNVAAVRYGRARKETLDGQRELTQALLELRRLVGVEELISPAGELPVVSSPVVPRRAIGEGARKPARSLGQTAGVGTRGSRDRLEKARNFPQPVGGNFLPP